MVEGICARGAIYDDTNEGVLSKGLQMRRGLLKYKGAMHDATGEKGDIYDDTSGERTMHNATNAVYDVPNDRAANEGFE